MTITETMEWLGRPLTDNELTLFKFLIPLELKKQHKRILLAHGSLECDAIFLDAPIPQPALNGVFGVSVDEDGNETPNVTDRTLRGFSLQVTPSLDGSKAIVLLGAMERSTTRRKSVNADNLMDWINNVSAFGFTADDVLTKEEAAVLKNSPEYKGEEI